MTVNAYAKLEVAGIQKKTTTNKVNSAKTNQYSSQDSKLSGGKDLFERVCETSEAGSLSFGKTQVSSTYSFSSANALSRVASAPTQNAVRAISNNLRSQMKSIKNSNLDEAEKKEYISRIKKVIGKAERKIKALQVEERLAKQRNDAQRIKNREEAEKIQKKLIRKQIARKDREYSDIMHSDDIMGKSQKGENDPEFIDGNSVINSVASMEAANAVSSAQSIADSTDCGEDAEVSAEVGQGMDISI